MARENDMQSSKGSARCRRLFVDAELGAERLSVGEPEAHYMGRVLRLGRGDTLVVFNGRGCERRAAVERLERKRAELALGDAVEPLPEPATAVTLIQALVKSDAMDAIVQKATELGVDTIHAVKTDFSVIKLDAERAERRIAHWTRIARSACEQSGRHRPPAIHASGKLAHVLPALPPHGRRIAFHPGARGLARCDASAAADVCVLLGPEGGFSEADLAAIDAAGFARCRLGPRILRADTAAVAACTLVQQRWGDLG